MTKIKRDGFIFITWIGDHPPKHVHVYKDGKLVVKWDLENSKEMKGTINSKILFAIKNLVKEGNL